MIVAMKRVMSEEMVWKLVSITINLIIYAFVQVYAKM
jgi:hypothetical protein